MCPRRWVRQRFRFVVWAHNLTKVFDNPVLKRAKASIAKAANFVKRPRLFVHRTQVESMLTWSESRPEFAVFGILFLFTYVFLLRLPSEALPVKFGAGGLHCDGEKLTLELERRKNKPQGSRLVRTCWCKQCKARCTGCSA